MEKSKIKHEEKIKIKNKSIKKRIIRNILIAVITIFIILVVGIIGSTYFLNKKNSKTNLVINNNNVTSRLKEDLIIEDDTTYVSMKDIKNFFDKYITQDEETGYIVTTSDKKTGTMQLDNTVIDINGSSKKISKAPTKINDKIYLPISELKDIYDIELTYNSDSNTVIIDSLNKKLVKAYATKNIVLRTKPSLISKFVERVDKDSVVVIASDDSSGWTKIRTESGHIGYVKTNKLANYVNVRDEMKEEKQVQGKVSIAWDYFSKQGKAPDRSNSVYEGVNVVSPAFIYIDQNGKLQTNIGDSGKAYIEWAHNRGYKVWPIISNNEYQEGMMDATSNLLNNYQSRVNFEEQIAKLCIQYGFDGINVDFENMYEKDKDVYSRFIIELTPRLKEVGLVTSVDVTAPDGSPTWSLCFDRNVIGDVADYIVFMAYDQYSTGSKKSGTTAGYNWIETSLKKFITTEEITPEKIILALPLYTRIWTENSSGEVIKMDTVNIGNIDKALPSGVQKNWDDDLKQYYVEYKDNNNVKKIWIEDIKSLTAKLGLVTNYKLGGTGIWELDRGTDEVYHLFQDYLDNN